MPDNVSLSQDDARVLVEKTLSATKSDIKNFFNGQSQNASFSDDPNVQTRRNYGGFDLSYRQVGGQKRLHLRIRPKGGQKTIESVPIGQEGKRKKRKSRVRYKRNPKLPLAQWLYEYTLVFCKGGYIAVFPTWIFLLNKTKHIPVAGGYSKRGGWPDKPLRTAQYRFGRVNTVALSALGFSATGKPRSGDTYFLTRQTDYMTRSPESELPIKYAPIFSVNRQGYTAYLPTQKINVRKYFFETTRDLNASNPPLIPYAIDEDGTQYFGGGVFAISNIRVKSTNCEDPEVCAQITQPQGIDAIFGGLIGNTTVPSDPTELKRSDVPTKYDLEKEDIIAKDPAILTQKFEEFPGSEFMTYISFSAEGVPMRSSRNHCLAPSIAAKLPSPCADSDEFLAEVDATIPSNAATLPDALQTVIDAEVRYRIVESIAIPDYMVKSGSPLEDPNAAPSTGGSTPPVRLVGTIKSIDVTDMFADGPCKINTSTTSDGKTSVDVCDACEERVQSLFGLPPDICSTTVMGFPLYVWWVMAGLWYWSHGYPATSILNPCNLVCSDTPARNPILGTWDGKEPYKKDIQRFYIADERLITGVTFTPAYGGMLFTATGNMSNVWPITFDNVDKVRVRGDVWTTTCTGCELLRRIREAEGDDACFLPIGIHPIGAPCFVLIDYNLYYKTAETRGAADVYAGTNSGAAGAPIPLACFEYKWAQIRQTELVETVGGCLKPRTPKIPPFHVFYMTDGGQSTTQFEGVDKFIHAEAFCSTYNTQESGWGLIWDPALYKAAICNTEANPAGRAGYIYKTDFNIEMPFPVSTLGLATRRFTSKQSAIKMNNSSQAIQDDQEVYLDCKIKPINTTPTNNSGSAATCPDYSEQMKVDNYNTCCELEGQPWLSDLQISFTNVRNSLFGGREIWPAANTALESRETTWCTFPTAHQRNLSTQAKGAWRSKYEVFKTSLTGTDYTSSVTIFDPWSAEETQFEMGDPYNKTGSKDLNFAGVWGWLDIADGCNKFQGVILTDKDPTTDKAIGTRKLYINGMDCTETLPERIGCNIEDINCIMSGWARERIEWFGIPVTEPDDPHVNRPQAGGDEYQRDVRVDIPPDERDLTDPDISSAPFIEYREDDYIETKANTAFEESKKK